MRMMAGAAALLVGLLAAACNGEVVGGGQRPARVVVVSGDLQSDTVGRELAQPLVVRVVDERDKPVKNQLVNFVVTAGGGSVFAGSALTNAEGEARERWTLGTVAGDTQRVEARAVDAATGEAIVFDTFRAIGVPDVLAGLVAVGPATRTGTAEDPLADSLAVRAVDRYGNPLPGVTVTWTATAGGGAFSPATSVTGPSGVARSQWTLGSVVGGQAARATAGALEATFTAAAGPLPPATLQISPRVVTFNSLGERTTLTVVARDRTGVAIGGVPVTLISENAGVAGLEGSSTVFASGNGTTRVIASAGALRDTATITVQQVPASVSPLFGGVAAVAPDTPVPGAGVQVSDAQGNPIAGVVVGWRVVSGGGTLAASSTTTGQDGKATVDWRLAGVAGVQTLEAQVAGRPATTLTARLRLPATVTFVETVSVPPNGTGVFTVLVRDTAQVPLPNTLVSWSISGTGGTVSPAQVRTGADGRAQATVTGGSSATNFTLRAQAGGAAASTTVQITGPVSVTYFEATDTRGMNPSTTSISARLTSSAGAITEARVSVGGRERSLAYDDGSDQWKGSVDLAGLPGGNVDGTLAATDAAGNTRKYLFTVAHNANPVVTIVEPAADTVTASGSIRVRVICTGLLSSGANVCPTLFSELYANSTQVVALAQGRSEITVDVPLPTGPSSVRILVRWADSKGVYYYASDELVVNVP